MKPLPIQPQHGKGDLQNPMRRAALEFVRAYPGCRFCQIEESVRHLNTGTPENLYYHLTRMGGKDLLYTTGERPHVRYYPGPRPAPPALPNVAPPRQVQVMLSKIYMPPRASSLRPGAMDFMACPSRGHRC